MKLDVDEIVDAVKSHHALFKDVLPMIASENVTSRTVRSMMSSDLAHRYAEGNVGNRFYQGCEFVDVIEQKAIELAEELFTAEHVNVQPISGVNANIAAFFALSEPKDGLMELSIPHGAHISHSRYSSAGIRKLDVIYHPFDEEEMNIEVNAMIEMIHREKPRLILFGASLFLFPHPVKEAVEAAEDVGAKIIYDASHVLGLIAGGLFQDPLREGADVITSSTHKTFPGPQGGIIICKPDIAEEIDAAVFPGTVSNHHLHHLAGLAITLAEMIEFGESYARQIVSNAKVLASELHEGGLNVLCEKKGFTESHQVVLDVSDGSSVAEELERANIITNKMLLPHDSVRRSINPSGLRLGVQELTRIGMKESEMIEIADLIKRVVIDGETEEVKREVTSLKENYQDVHYCFDGRGAYEFPL